MFLLFKQKAYEEMDEMGEYDTHFCQAEQFTIWEHEENAIAFVQAIVEREYKHCTNIPTNFRVENNMIVFDYTLRGKVIEVCDYDYYIYKLDTGVKPHIAFESNVEIEKTTKTPQSMTFAGRWLPPPGHC